jgi:hypothetical protein
MIDAGKVKADDPQLEVFKAGKCAFCGEAHGTVQHQYTAYVDEIQNWIIACEPCSEQINEYWKERWAEYYAGCL